MFLKEMWEAKLELKVQSGKVFDGMHVLNTLNPFVLEDWYLEGGTWHPRGCGVPRRPEGPGGGSCAVGFLAGAFPPGPGARLPGVLGPSLPPRR